MTTVCKVTHHLWTNSNI